MPNVICPLCARLFKNTVPQDHKCQQREGYNPLAKNPRTIKELKKLKSKTVSNAVAIDFNTENLGWAFGSDGASFLINNAQEHIFKAKKPENIRNLYFRAVARFLHKRYDYIYVGNWMPTEEANLRVGTEQFRAILHIEGQTRIISEKNTTVTCSVCRFVNDRSYIKVKREFNCQNCEELLYRDENAAHNILSKYHPEIYSGAQQRFIIRMFRQRNGTVGCDVSCIEKPITIRSKNYEDFVLRPTRKMERLQLFLDSIEHKESPASPKDENQNKIRFKTLKEKEKSKTVYKTLLKELFEKCFFCRETTQECLSIYNFKLGLKNNTGLYKAKSGRPSEKEITEAIDNCICLCSNCYIKLIAGILSLSVNK